MITLGSLFSGIGGLDLGLERAGMTVRWQAEIDPFCCEVLAKHWPDVPNLGDLRAIDWNEVERVDVLCGGYPCQPFSYAGARSGEDDPRHLWPSYRNAIGVLRPRVALLENVPGHLTLGFDRVLGDLVELGYNARWDCIPAAAVGAKHLRYRLFVVAYANSEGEPGKPRLEREVEGELVPDADSAGLRQQQDTDSGRFDASQPSEHGTDRAVADADSQARSAPWSGAEQVFGPEAVKRLGRCRSSSGGHWASEPGVGRVAHGVPRRVDRLRALGNAVVPQVAEFIGREIMTCFGQSSS